MATLGGVLEAAIKAASTKKTKSTGGSPVSATGLGGSARSKSSSSGGSSASSATKTSYIDASGNKQTGYILNGTTYTDAAGTTPVGVGSIVDTAGGQYIKTSTGSMLYADYLKNNGVTPTQVMNHDTGAVSSGYIKNGVTYSDVLATTPVGVGSIVNTAGGQYIKTDTGSMLYADYLANQAQQSAAMQQLQNQLTQVNAAYEQALAVNNTAYAAQLEQTRMKIQQRIDALNQSYKDLNRQLYVDYMKSRKNLPQQLAAQGHTGGLTESAMLGLETGYQGQLAANERERLTGISDLEAGGLNSELELKLAQAQAQQELQDTAYNRKAALYAQMLEQKNREEDLAREEEETAYNRKLYAEEQAAQTAANTAYGYSADGGTYNIGSYAGLYFLQNAAPGAVMTGGDGSTWRKNADGSVTIRQNGKTYTVGGTGTAVSTGSSGSTSSFRVSSSGTGGSGDPWADVDAYVALGGDAEDYINANYKALGYSSASQAQAAYTVRMTQNTALSSKSTLSRVKSVLGSMIASGSTWSELLGAIHDAQDEAPETINAAAYRELYNYISNNYISNNR